MSHRLFLTVCFALFLTPLLPSAARACAEPGSYPDVTWTTHIQSITPQTGIAGMTDVYVEGYCFGKTYGNSSGLGFVSLGGVRVPAENVRQWTDYEIQFILPFDATTGDLVVTSSNYGHDDSETEATCCSGGCGTTEKWPTGTDVCGNDTVDANFQAVAPNPPLYNAADYPSDLVQGVQTTAPQYVNGTWTYFDGGAKRTFTLTQGSQNSTTGTWPITGTEVSNINGGPYPIGGMLDQYGDLVIETATTKTCLEYLILGPGDVTSAGYQNSSGGSGCPSPEQNFMSSLFPEADEGPYWYFVAPPLLKSQTDAPAGETPQAYGWAAVHNSASATYGAWQRTLSPLSASPGGSVAFAGRSVFEQTGAAGATDTCWMTGDPAQYVQEVTGVTGGGWYVYSDDTWYWDYIGMNSQAIDWYRAHQPNDIPCSFTVPQDMYIDERTASGSPPEMLKYTSSLLTFVVDASKIYSEVQPVGGNVVEECKYYPSQGGRKCNP